MSQTPRLPIPGQDTDNWGSLLNEFLLVAHHEDGRLRNTALVANVKDFGATGDGTTDDSDAIQAAIDSGGHVYFPAGHYRYHQLKFNNDNQQTTCGPDAVTGGSLPAVI